MYGLFVTLETCFVLELLPDRPYDRRGICRHPTAARHRVRGPHHGVRDRHDRTDPAAGSRHACRDRGGRQRLRAHVCTTLDPRGRQFILYLH